jgi:hypothetical protein
MAENSVSPTIVSAIADTNFEVIGNAPAQSLALVYQVMAHSISLSLESAQADHAGMMQIGKAVVAVAVTQIMSKI